MLGSALAFYDGKFSIVIVILTLICALLLQISVNLTNDLFDARSGVDGEERLGPIRVTQSGLITEKQLIRVIFVVVLLAVVDGLALMYFSSWFLIVFGLASVVAVFAYSAGPWPLASHAMGELTVFFFFGWLAVGGSYYVHTLKIDLWVLVFGSVAGFLSAAIMLVNNIRDIATDKDALKITLAVRLGDIRARLLYKVLFITALVIHLLTVFSLGWLSFVPVILVFWPAQKLFRNISLRQGAALNLQLVQTAQLECVYCVAMGAVLVILGIVNDNSAIF